MPIHPEDRGYTQFITPWGRYEYQVVPQGFLAAVDGQREVKYMGLMVGDWGIKPTSKMMETITEFQRPRDLTGVRSFFGLVEQVAWAFAKRGERAPFRELLKSSKPFLWTPELQGAFEAAKAVIAHQVAEGMESFEVGRNTAMLTDWSKVGIALAIVHQHCKCP